MQKSGEPNRHPGGRVSFYEIHKDMNRGPIGLLEGVAQLAAVKAGTKE